MTKDTVRTRFAPSPTGSMHIGNLRTALYEYLVAKSQGGRFILRIEDTDQERQVEGAVDIIYDTLSQVGLTYDEGPDIGGPYGPYVQSERKDDYKDAALKLIEAGHAYYCFCSPERLEHLHEESDNRAGSPHSWGYDRHCRNLPEEEVQARLAAGEPYVIRQKAPLDGTTSFHDEVFGTITVDNAEIEDQVLLKSDGFPTYNFANVIDDHAMRITHVVRGSEYLSSTPKYNLLYEALGYPVPTYIHLPLILGEDGQKLSKRHGATGFAELVAQGYLPEAITNYIALLGWAPSDTQEIFSLKDLCRAFTIKGISKSPSTFDYNKLNWFNAEYLRHKTPAEFVSLCRPYLDSCLEPGSYDDQLLGSILQPRISRLTEIPDLVDFLAELPADYDLELFRHKKMKTTPENALTILTALSARLAALDEWTSDSLHSSLVDFAKEQGLKNGQVMWPLRIAVSGKPVTPGGATEICQLLGQAETLNRISIALDKLREKA